MATITVLTRLETRRVKERFFYREVTYWKDHPLEWYNEEWDGYHWNKACQFLLDDEWEGFRDCLMNQKTETYVKEGKLIDIQYASPRLHAWLWSKCAKPKKRRYVADNWSN